MGRFLREWRRYRYRFVPWIARDFKRQIERSVPFREAKVDSVQLKDQLLSVVSALHRSVCLENCREKSDAPVDRWKRRLFPPVDATTTVAVDAVLYRQLGFRLECAPSGLGSDAGFGVFAFREDESRDDTPNVTKSLLIRAGDLVAIYPGTYYSPGEPLFWASLANPYIFRCADGMLLDGNSRGLSASIYRSLLYRDSVPEWDHVAADSTWMTSRPPRALNPLSIGQYVNNATIKSTEKDASVTRDPNVAYYEFDIQFPNEISFEQLRFLPYLHYDADAKFSMLNGERPLKVVALVATRDIFQGDELFSTYFSVVPR